MKSLQGLPRLISASVGAPGKARNLPADVQCIQYLFNLNVFGNNQGDAAMAFR